MNEFVCVCVCVLERVCTFHQFLYDLRYRMGYKSLKGNKEVRTMHIGIGYLRIELLLHKGSNDMAFDAYPFRRLFHQRTELGIIGMGSLSSVIAPIYCESGYKGF